MEPPIQITGGRRAGAGAPGGGQAAAADDRDRPRSDLYDKCTRLAETRLARSSLNYLDIAKHILTYIKHTLKHKLFEMLRCFKLV